MGTDAIGNKPVVSAIPVHFVVFRTDENQISPMYGAMRLHVDAWGKTLRGVDDEKTGRHLGESENQNRAATKQRKFLLERLLLFGHHRNIRPHGRINA